MNKVRLSTSPAVTLPFGIISPRTTNVYSYSSEAIVLVKSCDEASISVLFTQRAIHVFAFVGWPDPNSSVSFCHISASSIARQKSRPSCNISGMKGGDCPGDTDVGSSSQEKLSGFVLHSNKAVSQTLVKGICRSVCHYTEYQWKLSHPCHVCTCSLIIS